MPSKKLSAPTRSTRPRNRRRRARRSRGRAPLSPYMAQMEKYDTLLRDPCSADFAYPPYRGVDTGYLVRQTQSFLLTAAGTGFTAGAAVAGGVNFVFQIQPALYPSAYLSGNTAATAALGSYSYGATSPFVSLSSVKQYRAVAACVKWVPAGTVAGRSGVIGIDYSPTPPMNAGATANFLDSLQRALQRDPNGSAHHEIRWLPTEGDEAFRSWPGTPSVDQGCGTLTVVGVGIDATATSTTSANINGYIEYTCVYEWVPALGGALSSAPKMPSPFTTQQHQSTIKNLGAFLVDGVRAGAAAAATGVVQGAMIGVRQSISALSSSRRPARGMPLHLEL